MVFLSQLPSLGHGDVWKEQLLPKHPMAEAVLDAWLPDNWKQAHIARCAALGIEAPPTT
jgi:hypothetical protein